MVSLVHSADIQMAVSNAKISKADDRAIDKSASKARPAPPGLSIRNGPVEDDDSMDLDTTTNGSKRKSRSSIGKAVNYKDNSGSDDDDAPLVCWDITKLRTTSVGHE